MMGVSYTHISQRRCLQRNINYLNRKNEGGGKDKGRWGRWREEKEESVCLSKGICWKELLSHRIGLMHTLPMGLFRNDTVLKWINSSQLVLQHDASLRFTLSSHFGTQTGEGLKQLQ